MGVCVHLCIPTRLCVSILLTHLQTAPFRRLFETITQKVEGLKMEDIVLHYEGRRLYAGGSPKAATMRTDKTSEIRAPYLRVIKWSLTYSLQVLAIYQLG
jgi:hypothetical protein